MKITIHRGIDQIGGCVTEISTQKTRILIDLGQNLPDGEGLVIDDFANQESLRILTNGIDAIFYTHYHDDHLGLFNFVPEGIPQYTGVVAKQVILCKHRRLGYIKGREEITRSELSKIDLMCSFNPRQIIEIGDIWITPYFVSHSAYDAYMFLIEAEGTRILHTGDFRGNGYLGKGLLKLIRSEIIRHGAIDVLVTEGTMLSRLDERVRHENTLKLEMMELMKQYKNVFVQCSSTDLERLATIHAAFKALNRKPFVCDDFQKDILKIFSEAASQYSPLFNFGDPLSFRKENSKLVTWMQDRGFCMLVRPTDKFQDYLNFLEPLIDKDQTVFIFSMWKEYINTTSKHANKRYLDFAANFPIVAKIHTSGHASADFLAEVCNLVNPSTCIIPIHSEHSVNFQKLQITERLKKKVIIASKTFEKVQVEIK